jgi:hypothetical protein
VQILEASRSMPNGTLRFHLKIAELHIITISVMQVKSLFVQSLEHDADM